MSKPITVTFPSRVALAQAREALATELTTCLRYRNEATNDGDRAMYNSLANSTCDALRAVNAALERCTLEAQIEAAREVVRNPSKLVGTPFERQAALTAAWKRVDELEAQLDALIRAQAAA